MKKITLLMILACACLCVSAGFAYAGETDILLQKLVEKGVLTPGEAQQIGTETKETVKKEIAQSKYDLLPEWIQKTKFKGDFRLRYQWQDLRSGSFDGASSNSTPSVTNLARIRLRAGFETQVNDQVKAGFGFATNTGDPRSTNITLGKDSTANTPGSFKNISVDYAYGQYSPTSWLSVTGGKFKNPVWMPHNLIWDNDLNPEGVNFQADYRLNPYFGLFLNGEMFVLNYESNSGSDTMMYAIQPGFKYNLHDWLDVKGAVAGFFMPNIKGKAVYSKWATNSVQGGSYVYDYNSIYPNLELGFKEPFKGVPVLGEYVPYVGLFSEFIYNPSPETGKGGYEYGVKFGSEKVGDWGQWQARVNYDKLGRDAFLDIFPDSDRYNGRTNMQSWETNLEYGLGKNTSLGLNYHWAQSLSKQTSGGALDSSLPQQLVLVDWNLKW